MLWYHKVTMPNQKSYSYLYTYALANESTRLIRNVVYQSSSDAESHQRRRIESTDKVINVQRDPNYNYICLEALQIATVQRNEKCYFTNRQTKIHRSCVFGFYSTQLHVSASSNRPSSCLFHQTVKGERFLLTNG